jgi:hypothetical protein
MGHKTTSDVGSGSAYVLVLALIVVMESIPPLCVVCCLCEHHLIISLWFVGESGWNWSSPCSNIVWNLFGCFLLLLILSLDGYWVDALGQFFSILLLDVGF